MRNYIMVILCLALTINSQAQSRYSISAEGGSGTSSPPPKPPTYYNPKPRAISPQQYHSGGNTVNSVDNSILSSSYNASQAISADDIALATEVVVDMVSSIVEEAKIRKENIRNLVKDAYTKLYSETPYREEFISDLSNNEYHDKYEELIEDEINSLLLEDFSESQMEPRNDQEINSLLDLVSNIGQEFLTNINGNIPERLIISLKPELGLYPQISRNVDLAIEQGDMTTTLFNETLDNFFSDDNNNSVEDLISDYENQLYQSLFENNLAFKKVNSAKSLYDRVTSSEWYNNLKNSSFYQQIERHGKSISNFILTGESNYFK